MLDGFFYTNEAGQTGFFPSGLRGRRGYRVESAEHEHELRRRILRGWLVIGCIVILAGSLHGLIFQFVVLDALEARAEALTVESAFVWLLVARYVPMAILVLLVVIAAITYMRSLAKGMEPVAFRNGNTQMSLMLKSDRSALWLLFVIFGATTIGLVIGGIVMSMPILLLPTPIFAIGAVFYWRAARAKAKANRAGQDGLRALGS